MSVPKNKLLVVGSGAGLGSSSSSSSSSSSREQHTLAHPARFLARLMASGEQRQEEEEEEEQHQGKPWARDDACTPSSPAASRLVGSTPPPFRTFLLLQASGDGSVVPWTIDTKYYKAELALHLAETAESPSGGQAKHEDDACPFAAHGEDLQGVIVLCKGGVSPGEDEMLGLTKVEPWYVKARAWVKRESAHRFFKL